VAKKIKTKTDEIRKLSEADLKKEVDESYRRLFSLRLQKETLQLQNHRELPRMRRNIARLKTIEHQRHLAKRGGGA
jgi:large subunit ribosomal protein L29